MSHTITVTRSPATSGDLADDYEFEISGTCDSACEAWGECLNVKHRHPKNIDHEMDEWSTKRTPEEHRWIEGAWMVRNTSTCGLREAFADGDPMETAADETGYAPVGVYDVHVDWDGDWWLATLTPAASPAVEGAESDD